LEDTYLVDGDNLDIIKINHLQPQKYWHYLMQTKLSTDYNRDFKTFYNSPTHTQFRKHQPRHQFGKRKNKN